MSATSLLDTGGNNKNHIFELNKKKKKKIMKKKKKTKKKKKIAYLSEESCAGAEELPRETWISLEVVFESVVQLSAPVNCVDHLWLPVIHTGRNMDRAVGNVDRDVGKVLVCREDHSRVASRPVLVVLVPFL